MPDPSLFLALVLFAVALRRGGSPERGLAGALLAASAVEALCGGIDRFHRMHAVDTCLLALDTLLFAAIAAVALRANRVYPLWRGGVQIVVLSSHLARAALPDWTPTAYAAMNRMPFYVQAAVLALGLALHAARVRRFGAGYPGWIARD